MFKLSKLLGLLAISLPVKMTVFLSLIGFFIPWKTVIAENNRQYFLVKPGPEDVHRATLGADDLRQLGFPGEVPYFSGFNGNLQRDVNGSLFYVYQRLTGINNLFNSGIRLFSSEAAAASDFVVRKSLDEKEGYVLYEGPEVGDETVYMERNKTFGQQDIYSSMIRWRVGTANAYVSYESTNDYLQENRMKRLAERVSKRLEGVMNGSIKSKKLPVKMAKLMPPESISAPLGRVLGSSIQSPNSWGLIAAPDQPKALGRSLLQQGVNRLGYTRYQLAADNRQVIEAIVFPSFDSSKLAKRWLQHPLSESSTSVPDVISLRPGATGEDSIFVVYARGGNPMAYELSFAKGKNAASLYCYAPHAATSTTCETATRQLAEGWYQSLPK